MSESSEWYLAEPPGWIPVPAASAPDIQDKRVILAEPPGAFRYDMRAVSYPYTGDDGVVYVDVVSEHDWYRSRIRREPVPKSRYPVHRVWVEYRSAGAGTAPGSFAERSPATGAGHGGSGSSIFDRVVTLDTPPGRPPRRAQDVPDLVGRRTVVVQPDGPVYHRRAVSEPYVESADGDVSVTICSEYDWYRWAITREPPRAEACPIYLVWVD